MDPGMEIVPVSELKVGMFVAEPDCPWTDLPFSLQGFIIAEPAEIDTFKQHCQFVYIDRAFDRRAVPGRTARTRYSLAEPTLQQTRVSAEVARRQEKRRHFLRYLYDQDASIAAKELSRELSYIEPHFDSLQDSLRKTLDGLQVEDKVDFRNIEDKLGELSDSSLMRNPDAVMWLLRLKKADDHSFDQAMDVAVYLLLLGKHVGFTGKRLTELSLAGLLQDVGKTALPPSCWSRLKS
jgi:HD-GYP domain-containing protein (c-di-GMP phosphodiesterase class II)